MGEYRQVTLYTETEKDGCEAFKILLEKDDNVKQFLPILRHGNETNYFEAQGPRRGRPIRPYNRNENVTKIVRAAEEYDKKPERKKQTENAKIIANQLLKSSSTYESLGDLIKRFLPKDDDGKLIKTISLLVDVGVFIARAFTLRYSTRPISDGITLITDIFLWVKNELCPFVEANGGWAVVLEKTWAFIQSHQTEIIVGGLVVLGGLLLGGLLSAASSSAKNDDDSDDD